MPSRAQPSRRDDQPAFVLHAYPYRETSLIVEAFTAEYGRVALVARGAKRPRSELRGLLQAFQPLLLSWWGQQELKTLHKAEWRGGLPLVGGASAAVRILSERIAAEAPAARGSASGAVRGVRVGACGPRCGRASQATMLRRFEVAPAGGAGLRAAARRAMPTPARQSIPPPGTITRSIAARDARRRACAGHRLPLVRGATLLALAEQRYPDAETAAEAKRLMREVLDHYLEQRGIESRRVVQDLQALDDEASHVSPSMIELGVNIDHVATLRQARRTHEPDPVWAAVEAHLGGADGITVHLREDRRHIQDEDVRRLRELVHIKLNLEMAATAEMVGIACALKPEMAMLVPEGRQESHDRRRARRRGARGRAARRGAAARGCRDRHQRLHRRRARGRSRRRRASARGCAKSTPDRMPMRSTRKGRDPESVAVVARARGDSQRRVRRCAAAGMRFNAGHALNYFNVQPVAALPGVRELHIGHAIVSRAVFVGLREAVRQMKALMREAVAAAGTGARP